MLKTGNLVNSSVNLLSYLWSSFFLALGSDYLNPKSRMIFFINPLGLVFMGNKLLPPGFGDLNLIGDFDFYSEALRNSEL